MVFKILSKRQWSPSCSYSLMYDSAINVVVKALEKVLRLKKATEENLRLGPRTLSPTKYNTLTNTLCIERLLDFLGWVYNKMQIDLFKRMLLKKAKLKSWYVWCYRILTYFHRTWMTWIQVKKLEKRVQKIGTGDTYEIIISYLNV